jgi:serine/threonine protein kinase
VEVVVLLMVAAFISLKRIKDEIKAQHLNAMVNGWVSTGVTYHGKPADIWALGCTLYSMVLGHYPFKGETLQSTYEKVCVIYCY